MPESPEHQFLSESFLEILRDFSALDLYGYREADRRRFDFAAHVVRNWSRPLAGQTLWSHSEGLDKDVRMLLADRESDIKAYVARDNIKNHARLAEVIQDFKSTELRDNLFKLKVIWVPDGFDADLDSERSTMRAILQAAVVDDILFNVVFGKLTAQDVAVFSSATGILGLTLALLLYTASQDFVGNVARPSEALRVSAGPIRERLLVLQAAGFVGSPDGRPGYSLINHVTPKGWVFLDLLRTLFKETRSGGELSSELTFVLDKLGIAHRHDIAHGPRPSVSWLLEQVAAAESGWGLTIPERAQSVKG